MKQNIKNVKGGFFFSRDKNSLASIVKNTKKSENNLINAFEEMDSVAKTYNKSYINHIENLKLLDEQVHFNGMETIFKKAIMKDNFVKGHVDKTNQLLFRNYIIEGDVLPSTFRNEHLLNQIRNVIDKSFAGRDYAFIKYQTITDISKHDFVLNIVTIENIKHKKQISHKDFLIDNEKVKKFLTDILSTTKKNLKRTSLIAEFNDDDDDESHSVRSKKSRSNKSKNSLFNIGKSKKSKVTKKSKLTKKSKVTKKTKKSKKSVSKFEINNNKNNEPKYPQKALNEYMTDFEKKHRNNKIKEEQKAQQVQFPQQKLENKKDIILGAPSNYASPIQEGLQKQAINSVDLKCKSFGQDETLCNANKPDCYFTPYKQCIKSKFSSQNPNPTFGNLNPALSNPNLFTVQQSPAESLV